MIWCFLVDLILNIERHIILCSGPTYPACAELSYVITKAKDGDIIIMEEGVYTIDGSIEINGFENLVISGANELMNGTVDRSSSVMEFDFSSARLQSNKSFFNIVNCNNLTFQEIAFMGYQNGTHQTNEHDLYSLFSISNSSNIRFENVKFENFNLENHINESVVDIDEMTGILPDIFSLINVIHEYESFPSFDVLSGNKIPNNYSIPDIPYQIVVMLWIILVFNIVTLYQPSSTTQSSYQTICETVRTEIWHTWLSKWIMCQMSLKIWVYHINMNVYPLKWIICAE